MITGAKNGQWIANSRFSAGLSTKWYPGDKGSAKETAQLNVSFGLSTLTVLPKFKA